MTESPISEVISEVLNNDVEQQICPIIQHPDIIELRELLKMLANEINCLYKARTLLSDTLRIDLYKQKNDMLEIYANIRQANRELDDVLLDIQCKIASAKRETLEKLESSSKPKDDSKRKVGRPPKVTSKN